MKKILLLSCILILMPLSAFAATISVSGDQPSIQAGIDAAVDGDVYCSSSSTFSNCTFRNNTGEQSSQTVTINVNNDSPIANAGPDQIVPGNSVQLDGSGSYDPDGSIVSWSWILGHLDNSAYDKTATGETPTVSNLEYGNYTVTLTVTDNHGATGTDEMYLSVAAAPTYQEGDECPGWWLVP